MKPIIQPGGSDSAALDNVFEVMVGVGPRPADGEGAADPRRLGRARRPCRKAHRDFYSYCNSVMEPWDGPAAICAFAGNWVIAGMDRNGLRPLRYTITGDGLLLAGSEAGMVRRRRDHASSRRAASGPGQMIGVDLADGQALPRPRAHGRCSRASAAFSDWVKNITVIDSLVRNAPGEPAIFAREELRRRQLAAGFTHRGSGADPPSRWWRRPRRPSAPWATTRRSPCSPTSIAACTISSAQNFSQVTNPPIDSLAREPGDDPEDPARQSRQRPRPGRGPVPAAAARDRPVLLTAEFEAMRAYMGESAGGGRLHLRSATAASNALRDAVAVDPPPGRGRGARRRPCISSSPTRTSGAEPRRASR